MYRSRAEGGSKGRRVWRIALRCLLGAMLVAVVVLSLGYVVMRLWNGCLTDATGARPIAYWQAVGLLILARILTGQFFHGGHRRRRGCKPMFRRHREEKADVLDAFVERGRMPQEPR